ncbi:MAG: Sua5/YciO/YrdC/YwlC family protein [Proteobacteria bacterium]|uniref:L-threonylcarbamoyladenylate synthase n=1 Tax=Candidatus Enterousia excrementavium TaxID=2840789 RepID=A0A940IA49_9PROT|nr:Sua5/YciO/YrdC/YwlC family protein [Candidatus Enterousia excrementavium]
MTNLHDAAFVAELNNHLKSGGVIAFPTDTVWGLGALPTRAGADALFEIKRRPANKHLIIMSDNLAHIRPYMENYPARAFDLANKYWPGH